MHEIENKIIEIVCKISNKDSMLIDINTNIQSLGINSLMIVEILVNIEQQFSIEIPDEKLSSSNYKIMSDIYQVVHSLLEK